ncbi:hypothetical protein DFJ73DRAFT_811206, partial [Zopfochytrium polystomum]
IASFVRVYHRNLHLGGGSATKSSVRVGVIGDVATGTDHRGRRLASVLMAAADAHMREAGFPIAVLHAATLAIPLYASLGWRTVPMHYLLLDYTVSATTTTTTTTTSSTRAAAIGLRAVDAARDAGWMALLYGKFAVGVWGSFTRRDRAYWTDWVAASHGDAQRRRIRRVVADAVELPSSTGGGSHHRVAGYAIVDLAEFDARTGVSPITVQLREAFVARIVGDHHLDTCNGLHSSDQLAPLDVGAYADAMDMLLRAGVAALFDGGGADATPLADKVKVQVPAAMMPPEVVDAMAAARPGLAWLCRPTDAGQPRATTVDDGWMFKVLSPCDVEVSVSPAAAAAGGEGARATEVVRVANEVDLTALLQRPIGRFDACAGGPLLSTSRFGFFKTDTF